MKRESNMNFIARILDLLLGNIRLNENMSRLSKEVEILIKEAKTADRRITRLETYIEIVEKSRSHLHLKEIS
jgi:hypothetical protein